MGRKCCVPGCRSNYDNESVYTSCFKFPKDEKRRSLWIRSINRKDFNPSPTAVVCIYHFDQRFLIKEDKMIRDDGTLLVVQRKNPVLTSDAFPSIFKNQPSYLSKELCLKRKLPAEREKDLLNRDEEKFQQWCQEDIIGSFKEFCSKYKLLYKSDWQVLGTDSFILFYKVEVTECPKIILSLKIDHDLTVSIWSSSVLLNMKTYEWLLGENLKCDRWTKFENLMNFSLSSIQESFNDKLSAAVNKLNDCFNELEEKCQENDTQFEEENLNNIYFKLRFLKEQIQLLSLKQMRYSTDTLLWAAQLFFSYPASYCFMRNTKVLTLPHPRYLKKLSNVSTHSGINTHISYLKTKSNLLTKNEKIVNLLLDEIYITPNMSYKGGQLVGIAENLNEEATTIQSFMITSLFSKNKDIVSLFPVKNLTAKVLQVYVIDVLKILYDCGFTVLSIISDNNKINTKMFSLLSDGYMKLSIENPVCKEQKLFLLFDSVHLIKAVRNNWLNKTTENQTLFYPNINDSDTVSSASLSHLKKLYELEMKKFVKQAPKLSRKVLYPSSTERQNVLFALNLFHESNSAALLLHKNQLGDISGTEQFISFMLKWWNIVNVKKPYKGLLNRDELQNHIKSPFDKSVIFLKEFSSWLNAWNNFKLLPADTKKLLGIPTKGGFLSTETHFALLFTTNCLIELISYIFDKISPSYILLGKFQTDSLEARFGQYRQMSGGNYNVSFRQILESEKKIKILSLITLYSEKFGEFKIKDMLLSEDDDTHSPCESDIPDIFYEIYNTSDDEEITNSTMSVLVFIAGYVAYKVNEKSNCSTCVLILAQNKILEYICENEDVSQYLYILDRGGLKWPQEFTVDIIVQSYQIFCKIMKPKYEEIFLRNGKQKSILTHLIIEKLDLINYIPDITCTCGTDYKHLAKRCISIISNILLNNYCKVKNDKLKSSAKRKISTYKK